MDKNASLLDSLLEQAERAAEEIKANRSRLDTQALYRHVDRHNADKITTVLNRVYLSQPSRLDFAWSRLQTRSLSSSQW